jgi:hypothetical protein
MLKSKEFLQQWQTKAMIIRTDNTTTSFNINRGAAAVSLAKLTDRILVEGEILGI